MPTDTLYAPAPNTTTNVPASHALHVKAVPYDVWCRTRHNANLSRMTLRDYVIRLLAEAQPFPRQSHTDSKGCRPPAELGRPDCLG
jgi:hypothetical protein